jgi:hypothetical protein
MQNLHVGVIMVTSQLPISERRAKNAYIIYIPRSVSALIHPFRLRWDSCSELGLSRPEGRDISVSARRQGAVSPSNFKWFCLFDCFESHEQFFSYLATVTIAGDRAANLDLCLALTASSVRVLLRATPTATRDLRF